jgi:hypothetical protein
VNYSPSEELVTLNSFDEAVNRKESRQWKLTIKEHLCSLEANHTWEIVNEPKDTNLISTKWVFKIKILPNGQINKYKARLYVRGFSQEYGVDYFKTFIPVIRIESLRVLLALATT